MGRQALAAVICCLALSKALGEEKKVNSSIADNESAESVPRLYQNIPVGVYASAAPHGAYSIHRPSVVTGPIAASSQVKPVKSVVVPSPHGFLKDLRDSYGKFVSPSQGPYKMAYPQQYVQLQALPAHLTQPLAIAAGPSLQYKQAVPHYIFGSQPYRVPVSQSSGSPTPLTHFGQFSQPLVYAENIRGFAPSSSGFFASVPGFSSPQKQTDFSAYHSDSRSQFQPNTLSLFHSNTPSSFQRLQAGPESAQTNQQNSRKPKTYEESYQISHSNEESHSSRTPHSFSKHSSGNDNKDTKQENSNEKGQIQAQPAQTSVTAIVNGKKTVVTLETKPPLPLLDINLLEPLKFDNPVVPQVQQFLPRINDAKYYKLPKLNANDGKKNYNKQFTIQNTKTYDSGVVVGKPKVEAAKKKNKKQNKPAKPTIIVSGDPNGSPEVSYEINSPNYKETYNEQVVSYNKNTNTEPVSYSYNNKKHEEPVTYSFSHSSKEPLKIQHVQYESNPENPKELIFTFTPEDQVENNEQLRQPPRQQEHSEESSDEIEDDDQPSQPQQIEHHNHHSNPPNHHINQGHYIEVPHPQRQSHHEESPRNSQRHETPHHHSETPNHHHQSSHHHHETPNHQHESPNHHHDGQSNHYKGTQDHHQGPPRLIQHYLEVPPTKQTYHQSSYPPQKQHNPNSGLHDTRQSHQLQPEHRQQEYRHLPHKQVQQKFVKITPQFFSTPLTFTVKNAYQAITPEYEEDIRLLKPHQPNAPIKVDPSQHVQQVPTRQDVSASPSPAPQKVTQKQTEEDYGPHSSSAPRVLEKSKGVIIKEEILDENPDDDEPSEPIEEVDNEEDFEKAYKNSAFGFPAYEENDEEKEKDIFDPESYGVPKYHSHYDIQNSPFQQYQEDGDEFPKSTRSNYKDTRDKMKEDYFLDYAVNKPQTFADHYRKKEDYYKTFKHNRPEKLFVHEEEKPKQKEKYVLASPSFSYPSSIFKPKEKKQFFIQYKAAPKLYEFDYSKVLTPKDSSPFASSSQPFRKYKTHFVEPQFHYGFSPITAPLVLDSELAAMASNHSPESEKPKRKKIYKENWYIKKTSTTAGKPS